LTARATANPLYIRRLPGKLRDLYG